MLYLKVSILNKNKVINQNKKRFILIFKYIYFYIKNLRDII